MKEKSRWQYVGFLCPICFTLNKRVLFLDDIHEVFEWKIRKGKIEEREEDKRFIRSAMRFMECNHESYFYTGATAVSVNTETNEVECSLFFNEFPKEIRKKVLDNLKKTLNNPNLRWMVSSWNEEE